MSWSIFLSNSSPTYFSINLIPPAPVHISFTILQSPTPLIAPRNSTSYLYGFSLIIPLIHSLKLTFGHLPSSLTRSLTRMMSQATTTADFENILMCYTRSKNKRYVFLFICGKTLLRINFSNHPSQKFIKFKKVFSCNEK